MAFTPYITYEKYVELGGTVAESAFPLTERKAQRLLDYWTQNRIKGLEEIPDEVLDCLVVMIDNISTWTSATDGDRITSFSNGKVSFSYDTSQTNEKKSMELYQVALAYLPISLITGVIDGIEEEETSSNNSGNATNSILNGRW